MRRVLVQSLMCVLCSLPVAGVAALTEQQALAHALESTAFSQWLAARAEAAREDSRSRGRWHNPELSYARETLDLPGGEAEETEIMLSQRFNLAGIKALERRAARHQRDAELARIALLRRERVAQVRLRFHQALKGQQQLQLMQRWFADLSALRDAIVARAAAGDVSRYDRLRMDQALALAHGRLASQRSDTQAALAQLSAITGMAAQELTGDLLPPAPQGGLALDWLPAHPLVQALGQQQSARDSEARAEGRRRWPDMTLGVGRKDVSEPGLEADGNVVSLGIDIPLGDAGGASAGVRRQQARQLAAEREMTLAQLRADALAVHTAWQAEHEASQRLSGTLAEGELTAIARAAYEAGEVSIMALLDAYDSWLEVESARLSHALAARQAHIDWQTLTGE